MVVAGGVTGPGLPVELEPSTNGASVISGGWTSVVTDASLAGALNADGALSLRFFVLLGVSGVAFAVGGMVGDGGLLEKQRSCGQMRR